MGEIGGNKGRAKAQGAPPSGGQERAVAGLQGVGSATAVGRLQPRTATERGNVGAKKMREITNNLAIGTATKRGEITEGGKKKMHSEDVYNNER